MTVEHKHQTLYEELSLIHDRQERLSEIVERGRRGEALPMQNKTPAQRVPGCVSPVWVDAVFRDGRLYFHAEAEAPVVNGLVRLLCELYDGATPEDVAASEPRLLEALDLVRDLSPTRQNGLRAVRSRVRAIAEHYLKTG